MTIDTKQLRADALGLAGRFFYDAERGDIAYIAKDCDDRTCDCEKKLNSDGDQDCAFSIADGLDDHVAEPLVRMLNAVGPLLDELAAVKAECERLRRDNDSWSGSDLERQLSDARSQLAAVTKARDEACDWLADMVGDRDDREEFDG